MLLFDAYVHGNIDRRGFLDRASKYAVGGTSAAMLLEVLSPKFAEAQQVPKDDPRLKAELVEYRSEEHTSELQSLRHLVCRLLLEKKKKRQRETPTTT